MNRVESEFHESEIAKLWISMRYIDHICLIRTENEDKLEDFLQRFNAFHPSLKF